MYTPASSNSVHAADVEHNMHRVQAGEYLEAVSTLGPLGK